MLHSKMCDKVILKNTATLKFVPYYYKNQKMCYEAADNYAHALDFVPDCYNTQEMCNKDVDACSIAFVFDSVSDQYKTQKVGDKAVDACLTALKLFPISSLRLKCLITLILLYSLKIMKTLMIQNLIDIITLFSKGLNAI